MVEVDQLDEVFAVDRVELNQANLLALFQVIFNGWLIHFVDQKRVARRPQERRVCLGASVIVHDRHQSAIKQLRKRLKCVDLLAP
jgi:hypothetical protein